MLLMKKVFMLTLLVFAIAAFTGCGKKAPPRPPDTVQGAVIDAPVPSAI